MRNRNDIYKRQISGWKSNDQSVYEMNVLEVLLDIRDLLANPPVEISGKEIDRSEITQSHD